MSNVKVCRNKKELQQQREKLKSRRGNVQHSPTRASERDSQSQIGPLPASLLLPVHLLSTLIDISLPLTYKYLQFFKLLTPSIQYLKIYHHIFFLLITFKISSLFNMIRLQKNDRL